jgi:hypothetical protein
MRKDALSFLKAAVVAVASLKVLKEDVYQKDASGIHCLFLFRFFDTETRPSCHFCSVLWSLSPTRRLFILLLLVPYIH